MSLSTGVNLKVSEGWLNTMAGLEASDTPFIGSLLSRDASTGFVHRLVAGEPFAGICLQQILAQSWNPVSPSNGDIFAQYASGRGFITVPLAVTQLDAVKKRNVYASDDGTFTFSPCASDTSANTTLIGHVVDIVSTSIAIVEFTTDDVLDLSSPGVRGVYTLAAGSQAVTAALAGFVLRTQGSSAQTITLPAMADWIGKTFTIVNGVSGQVTIAAISGDGSCIRGASTLAQPATTIGITTVLYSTGKEIVVLQNA